MEINATFFLVMGVIISGLSQAYEDGKTTMCIHERKASLKEFYSKWTWELMFILFSCNSFFLYSPFTLDNLLDLVSYLFFNIVYKCYFTFISLWSGVIFPSLLQLQRGITEVEERKQKDICATKYKRKDEFDKGKLSEIELEREEECDICMEMNSKVVLPNCNHSMCIKCYQNWWVNFACVSFVKLLIWCAQYRCLENQVYLFY